MERRAANLWRKLLAGQGIPEVSKPERMSDDELDARVAWLLGRLWLDGNASVEMVGSQSEGGFLLPIRADETGPD